MDVAPLMADVLKKHNVKVTFFAANERQACGLRDFAAVDVLADPEIRAGIKAYANWPTIPQLYVNGELVGGADIVREMYESGELQTLVNPSGAS